MSEEVVFRVSNLGRELTALSRIGDYLDRFSQLAEISPRYLPTGDWVRHRQLLTPLRLFKCWNWGKHAEKKCPIVDFPCTRLPYVLKQWVEAIARSPDSHVLASTMALEAATVLWDHARGCRIESLEGATRHSIAPLVHEFPTDIDREVADQNLKKCITQFGLRGLEVLARVPQSASLKVFNSAIDRADGTLHFIVERCHQSQSWSEQYEVGIEGIEEPLDLSSHFVFYGRCAFHLTDTSSEQTSYWWNRGPQLTSAPVHGDRLARMYLPIRWITHTVDYSSSEPHLNPIPEDWSSETGTI